MPCPILVRNLYMSVDPFMRGRMNEGESYIAPFQIGSVFEGGAVGAVVDSADDKFRVGDAVSHFCGWRDHALLYAGDLTLLNTERVAIQAYLGALGLPGHAAYFGLLHIARPKAGETVFVSSAAGAVGSVVAQIAKLKGCRVIGSVGSEAKAQWLREDFGLDAVINYNEEPDLEAALRRAAPEGIDVYFDNVGGAHLEAAIAVANNFARFPLCGMVGQYNGTPTGPSNIYTVIAKSLQLQGFIGINHLDTWADFTRDMSNWIARPDRYQGNHRRWSRSRTRCLDRTVFRRKHRQNVSPARIVDSGCPLLVLALSPLECSSSRQTAICQI